MRFLVLASATMVALAGSVMSTDAVGGTINTITYDGDLRPIRITNLSVAGYGAYHVDISYNVTFRSIFGTGDPPSTREPLFWGDSTGASDAATEIATVLNADASRPGDPPFTQILTPYERRDVAGLGTRWPSYVTQTPGGLPYANTGFTYSRDDTTFEQVGWARMSPSPNLPPSYSP